MQEQKMDNLELFYDCVEEQIRILYDATHKSYFDLLKMAVENILEAEVTSDVEKDDEKKIKKILKKMEDVDFSVEDVRKSMQTLILRGFKEEHIPNGATTPDTLGIFIAYLVTKICKNKEVKMLDPLCGTGNLLFTVANYLDKECKLYACDNDDLMANLTSMTSNLLDYDTEVYLQDTLSLSLSGMDAVIFDMPHKSENEKEYFPYKAILNYKEMLNDNGALIGIVENDFFNYDKTQDFKNELLKEMSIIGLVELPDDMFKTGKPKIILVLQKKKYEKNNCFMVKLPNFKDAKEFNNSLVDIEKWFEKNKYNSYNSSCK